MTETALHHEIAQEQDYVSMLYEVLDRARERATADLRRAHSGPTTGTDQAATERESFARIYAGRSDQLWSVERGLCFGRIDTVDGARFYVGRIGLFDDDHDALLIDWRAPVAQPFYRATAADPAGVFRRRHIRLAGRTVVGVDDDLLDLDALDGHERSSLIGEAALFATLSADRTGRMSEIVATIQAEQDAIIRSGLPGVLVVQGGPGTGKTVVALHRAAYLLYSHREQLARRGVLVVGPNPTFLRYIEQVLPSLGETEVVLSTIGSMLPGRGRQRGRVRGGEPDQGPDLHGGGHRPGRPGRAAGARPVRRHARAAARPGSGPPRSDSPPPHRSSPPPSAPRCTARRGHRGRGPTWRCWTRRPTCSATPTPWCSNAAGQRPSAPPRTPSISRTPPRWCTASSPRTG